MVRSGKERIPVQTDLKWRIVFVLEPVTTRLLTYVVTRKRPPIDMPQSLDSCETPVDVLHEQEAVLQSKFSSIPGMDERAQGNSLPD